LEVGEKRAKYSDVYEAAKRNNWLETLDYSNAL